MSKCVTWFANGLETLEMKIETERKRECDRVRIKRGSCEVQRLPVVHFWSTIQTKVMIMTTKTVIWCKNKTHCAYVLKKVCTQNIMTLNNNILFHVLCMLLFHNLCMQKPYTMQTYVLIWLYKNSWKCIPVAILWNWNSFSNSRCVGFVLDIKDILNFDRKKEQLSAKAINHLANSSWFPGINNVTSKTACQRN